MKKKFYTSLLLLFIYSILHGQVPVSGTPSGYTAGAFLVTDGGAATYSIPLSVVPGTKGVQPNLVLTYSSQGANGIFGQGIVLQGNSAIARSGQTIAQDGRTSGISFTEADRFALDGQRLVLADPTVAYGSQGSEYRTEQNTFHKIVANGTTSTPTYFIVRTNSGSIIEYGNTTDSRVSAGGQKTIWWMVNKIADTKGNYMTFSYSTDNNTGECYPIRIDYTGNSTTGLAAYASVQFTYESRRDSVVKYINGVAITTNKKRVKTISSYYGTTLVRKYQLTYNEGPSYISQLSSIKEYGSDGRCHTPTNFIWSNTASPVFSATDINNISQSSVADQLISTDINADGVLDIIKIQPGNNVVSYVSNKNISSLAFDNTAMVSSSSVAVNKSVIGDFDGNGKEDILSYDSITGSSQFFLNTTAPGSATITFNTVSSPIASSIFSNGRNIVAIDFDNNGTTDILSVDPNTGTNDWLFSRAAGTTSVAFVSNSGTNYFTNIVPDNTLFRIAWQPFLIDFNGDGQTDILFYNSSNGNTQLYNSHAGSGPLTLTLDTTNFIEPSLLMTSGGAIKITDINGDGLPDVIYYVQSTGAINWWINKGNKRFVQAAASGIGSLLSGGTDLLPMDFNGDGYVDLVWIDKTSGNNIWLANDGKLNFTQVTSAVISPGLLAGYDVLGVGNFTSKSNFDIFLFNNSASPKARILKGGMQLNNVLTQIQVGSGQVIDINYDLLTSDSVYTKANSAVYPLVDYQATQFVVNKWRTDNGIGGKSIMLIKYNGAKMHLLGHGFIGFSEVDNTDSLTGITTSRYFYSDTDSWKYANSPLIKTTTTLPGGLIVKQADIVNGLTSYGGQCNYSFVASNCTKSCEIDGSLIDSTTISYAYDNFGNLTQMVTNFGCGYVDSLVNVFDNSSTGNWLIGRLQNSHLYRMAPSKPTIVKASAFEYDMAGGTGLLIKEISEPDLTDRYKVIKTYQYDVYGNIISSSVTAWGSTSVQTRTTNATYDERGRFITSFSNALDQASYKTTDPLLGKTLTETDLNGLVTSFFYDGFGRLIKTVYPDGNWQSIDYRKNDGSFVSAPANCTHLIYTQSSLGKPVIEYFDLLNRSVRTHKIGPLGGNIYIDAVYNDRVQIFKQSLPYFDTSTALFTEHYYDILGRETKMIEPGNRVDSFKYEGRKTTIINSLNQVKTITRNCKDQVIISRDNQGNNLSFEHDAAGRLVKTTDPNGNNITITYDIHGNKIAFTDPDMGSYTYVVNGFGEVLKQTDPAGNITTMTYDLLGRIITRTEPEGTTVWTYDDRANGIGKVGTVTSYNGYVKTYTYDSLGRVINETQTIQGINHSTSLGYDVQGRIKTYTYPDGFKITNLYNTFGFLYKVKNGSSGATYWTANAINARNEIIKAQYGNGTTVYKTYDANTDFLTGISTRSGSTVLQNMSLVYDALGNVTRRSDDLFGYAEEFTYDDLNRLTLAHVIGGDSICTGYDAIGNIKFKSNFARNYVYGVVNNGPHRLIRADTLPGACIRNMRINTFYTSFDKVKQITRDSVRIDVLYNPDRMRNVQKLYDSGRLKRVKIYVSSLFEQQIIDGDTTFIHYINTPAGNIATYVTHSETGIAPAIQYNHRDHLGSIVMITDGAGQVTGRYSYDAWGKRRNPDWSATLTDTTALAFDRAFTGHELYSLFDIIDCNGRIYDPESGRFLSPDPYIDQGLDLESYNRYSYCNNNPVSYVDPTGYFKFKKLFKSVVNVITSIFGGGGSGSIISIVNAVIHLDFKTLAVAAVSIGVNYLVPGGGGIVSTLISNAVGGFATSATSSLLNGGGLGSALQSGLRGAVASAASTAISAANVQLTSLVGDVFDHPTELGNFAQKSIAHGIVQGVATAADGGKFINGFSAGAATTVAELGSNSLGITNNTARMAIAMTAGGTASDLTGGSFVNGAKSGAFIHMYNEINYSQSTGEITQTLSDGTEKVLGTGYAGAGDYINDPSAQDKPFLGPIPQGRYDIGLPYKNAKTGPYTMNLDPQKGTNTFGRDAFRMHGGDFINFSSSEGCIIAPPNVRTLVNSDPDRVLNVRP